jgi:hypothetical protein
LRWGRTSWSREISFFFACIASSQAARRTKAA